MKLRTILGLAAVAVLMTLALVGPASAAAEVQLCKAKEQPCGPGNLLEFPTIWLRLKTGTLVKFVSQKTFECNVSVFEGDLKELSEGQVQYVGPATRWTFEGCTEANGAGSCTVKALPATTTPFTIHLWANEASVGNGHMAIGPEAEGKTTPGFEIRCFSGLECTFAASEQQKSPGSPFEEQHVWVGMQITGGSPAVVASVNQAGKPAQLTTTKGQLACGNTGELKVEYEVLAPKPFWVTYK